MASRSHQPVPPTFDAGFYRARNPDLALADDAAAVAHYAEHGRAEGRVASPLAVREGLVAAIERDRPVLEIGPFCAPLLAGAGVEYLDRLDAAGLRARAAALGLDTAACPARIHHVGGLDAVADEAFEAVLASHSIEHQPDLVRHLEEVARVLRTNGRYLLIVPDKRFCFDHFLPESSIADVLDAFEEERTRHRLGSVVEHVALVTHNDPVRHWRGDHGGEDEAERSRRTAEALAAYRRSDGDYLDVHAWQFTPASFAGLFGTLARLGLSAFEVEGVYDTPRDRAEFCAVLRRARPARRAARRRHGQEIVLLQTADPFRDARLLAVTAPNVTEYCRRHGLAYESFVGIKRGTQRRDARFDHVAMLEELTARGFTGWVVWLAADAHVRDLDFALPDYLNAHDHHAAILAGAAMRPEEGGAEPVAAFVNLGHPLGRRLVEACAAALASRSDEAFHHGEDPLRQVLRGTPDLADAVYLASVDAPDAALARFVRQPPSRSDPIEDRLATIRDHVAAVARAAGIAEADPSGRGGRAAARLLHAIEGNPWLAEAPPGVAGEAVATRALTTWVAGSRAPGAGHQHFWVEALEAGDHAALGRMVATLGRVAAGQSVLGGDRQHRRCADDPAFAHERALRAHDALLSLAELTGAVGIESPDLGAWGRTRWIAAPALFAAAEQALGADLAPPATIGAYLGIEAGRGIVLHPRMIEAMHAAWRASQLAALLGLAEIVELGGGIGLTAWYARRLGLPHHRLAAPAASTALQAAVLSELAPAVPLCERIAAPLDLLMVEDLATWPEEEALRHLGDATAHGARAILSFGQDAAAAPAQPRPTVADLLARVGGWCRVGRARHGLRPGYHEEVFLRRG